MRAALLYLPLLLLTCGLNTGCTAMMWAGALDSKVSDPQVKATLTQRGQQRVLVHYYCENHRAVMLPVDRDGRLAGPLVYEGLERDPEAILKDLPVEQRQAIRQFRFRREVAWTDTPTVYVQDSGQRVDVDMPEADCVMVALGPDNQPLPLIKGPEGRMRFAEDARIVLIPRQQPRETGEQAAHIAAATVCTPLTVAADVILIPVVILVLLVS